MSLLLIQFEYMNAKAKQTMLEAKVTRLNNLHERYTKKIETVTSIFSKREQNIETTFTNAQSRFSAAVTGEVAGVGTQTLTTGGTTTSGTTTSGTTTSGTTSNVLKSALTVACSVMGHTFNVTCQAGTAISAVASQMNAILQDYLNAAKENELNKLELAKEAQLDPIQEKDIDIDLKKTTAQTLLDLTDARVEKAEKRLETVAKSSVAGYGLS